MLSPFVEQRSKQHHLKQTLHLPGVGDTTINVAKKSEARFNLTGRQALALLRLLEGNRATLELEAEAEREREFGRGPGTHLAEIPQKIRKGDPRIGRQAISQTNAYQRIIEGKVSAILRYSNGAEEIEITRAVFALDSNKPGTETAWVHADDVDIPSY